MHPVFIPGVFLASTIGAFLYGEKKKPSEAAVALETPTVAHRIAIGVAANGIEVQAFRLAEVHAVMQGLGSFGVVHECGDDSSDMYRLVALDGNATAAQAAYTAQAAGLVVMAAFDDRVRYLIFCEPDGRAAAERGSNIAVLLDVTAPPVAAQKAAAKADVAMPANVLARVQLMLAEESPDTAALRRAAASLDGRSYPVAAKMMRDRADAVDLERELVGDVAPPASVGAEPREEATMATEEQPGNVAGAVSEHSATVEPSAVVEEVAVEVVKSAHAHLNGAAKHSASQSEEYSEGASA